MSDKNNDKNSYSFPEACVYLGMSRKTLQKYVDNDEIASYPAGNRRRFTKEALDRHRSGGEKGSASPAETNSEGAIEMSPKEKELKVKAGEATQQASIDKAEAESAEARQTTARIKGDLLTSEQVITERAKNTEDGQANEEARQANKEARQANVQRVTDLKEATKVLVQKQRELAQAQQAVAKQEAKVERQAESLVDGLKTAKAQKVELDTLKQKKKVAMEALEKVVKDADEKVKRYAELIGYLYTSYFYGKPKSDEVKKQLRELYTMSRQGQEGSQETD